MPQNNNASAPGSPGTEQDAALAANIAIEISVIGCTRVWQDAQGNWWAQEGQNQRPMRNYAGSAADQQIAINKIQGEGVVTIAFGHAGTDWTAQATRSIPNLRGQGRNIQGLLAQDASQQMAGAIALLDAVNHPLAAQL